MEQSSKTLSLSRLWQAGLFPSVFWFGVAVVSKQQKIKRCVTIKLALLSLMVFLSGCAKPIMVRPQDLKSWEGVPVSALDTHSLFLTIPMKRTLTKDKVEIRIYSNKKNIGHCSKSGGSSSSTNIGRFLINQQFNSYLTCTSGLIGCDNIFYIKEGHVIRYAPTGRCYTDDTVRPEKDWQQLR